MVVAWFGGTYEKSPDVGIWLSRLENDTWTIPWEVANGIQNDTLRYPCWNPVLFLVKDELLLFYKVGPSPAQWWGEMKVSQDYGKSWSKPERLPENILGPIKNKPVMLGSGELVCPSSTEDNGWQVHLEFTADQGKNWRRTESLNNGDSISAIQPSILVHSDNTLQILCRSKSHRILSSWSYDRGNTWTELEPMDLPNNNSGIDGITLSDGRHLLVYNHIDLSQNQGKRNKLHVAVSDDGIKWKAVCLLENDENTAHEYSYPAVIQARNGKVHIVYTWRRELIRHVILEPEYFRPVAIVNGIWPEESDGCCMAEQKEK